MADFTPHAVQIAAKRVAAQVAAGNVADYSPLSTDELETVSFGCIVRVTIVDGALASLRVIDANGRHWFPDYEAAAA